VHLWIRRGAGAPPPEIVFSNLMEGIGLALDPKHDSANVHHRFAGSVYSANLDGSGQKTLLFGGGQPDGGLPTSSCPRPRPRSDLVAASQLRFQEKRQ